MSDIEYNHSTETAISKLGFHYLHWLPRVSQIHLYTNVPNKFRSSCPELFRTKASPLKTFEKRNI